MSRQATWAIVVLLAAAPGRTAEAPSDGLVVEAAPEGFAAHKAGLKPGDILHGWQRAASPPANPEPAEGKFALALSDVIVVEQEQAPRGELRVSLTRAGEPLVLQIPPGRWRLILRPRLSEEETGRYEEGRRLVATEKYEQGFSLWRDLARAWSASGDHARASWLFARLADAADKKLQWAVVDAALEDLARDAEAVGDRAGLALVHWFRGQTLEGRNELDKAVAVYGQALEGFRALGHSLGEAGSLERL